ncbi:hypothetical protein RHSIM_Rhsim12G0109500 [Rhododendron simsii]|uniref:BED-type domain-containing protein n=1 Tax=Rhododendron simsii TaxID=118357 RepID=A0A834G3H7_RHOSS|nr:hypothetical protein RHSIM_Rhsim12G0109500 [Rhododendron simsii]
MAMPPPRSRSPTPTGPTVRSSSVPPIWESDSTSTEIESNEAQLPTLDSSQAETESNLPTNEPEDLGYTSDGDKILSKAKCRSIVWEHFQKIKIKDSGVEKARCLYCKRKFVGDGKSGTTHLKDHTSSCFMKKAIDSKQKFITPSLMMGEGKKANIQSYSYDPEVARKQLAYMIIMHKYPLSMVEHAGFRRFCHALQPAFHVISRNTMKRDIFKIYDVEKVKTMRLIERNKSRVSLTTDMWTSISKKRGFMVITAHIIDDSWKLQSRILRFVYVPCPHTAEVLCQVLMDTFLEWNIDRKLSTLTVDNCTTNDAMIDLLLEKLGGDHIRCKSLFHVRCAAHILNLIVKDGLDVIKSSIVKVRDSVAYWTATQKREETFEGAARQLGITYVEEMALNMLEKYDKYWDSTHGFLAVAVVLDPRFKMSLIEYYYKRIYGEHGVGMAEDIRRRCYDLLTLYQGKSSSKDRSESSSKAPPSTYLRDRTSLSDYLDQQKRTKTVHVKSELDRYLEEEQLPMCDEFDILAWWKSNGLKYPILQAIARDVLAVPVSTVASESSFSTSGRVVSPSRNRLHPKTLEALMCTQSWLAALENEEMTTETVKESGKTSGSNPPVTPTAVVTLVPTMVPVNHAKKPREA